MKTPAKKPVNKPVNKSNTKKNDFETKVKKVTNHLLTGKSITSWEAITLYRATRLSAIIFILKDRGYVFNTEMITDGGTRYAKYKLVLIKILNTRIIN